jgi:LysR family transcriptional regulator, nitrogen assimilation regulatory protein
MVLPAMTLKQLEYFVRIAELGSFTRAALSMDVAQPALSRQLRQLEVELRQGLFVRNGRGAVLTEAGARLLAHSRGILHQVARARDDLAGARDALSGRVAIGLPPSIAKAITIRFIRQFRKSLPEASLSIAEGLSLDMREWVLAGRLDLALLYNPALSPDLEVTPLMNEELFLIARRQTGARPRRAPSASAKPVDLKDIANMPLIIPNRPHALRTLVDAQFATVSRTPAVALQIDSVAAILELVSEGAGVAILPMIALRMTSRPRALVARRIVNPQVVSQLAIAVSSKRPITLTQQEALKMIKGLGRSLFAATT